MRNPSLIFFCELTNGHGTTKAMIRLVDVEQHDKVILEQEGQVEFKDTTQVVTLALNLRGVVFEHPGEYRFQLYSGENFLGDRKVVCRQIELPPKQETEQEI